MNERWGQKTRRFTAAFVGIVMLLLACPSLAAFEPLYARCNTNNLRIRSSAGTSGTIQSHLMDKDLVWAIDETTSGGVTYLKVEYVDETSKRQTGWVAYESGSTVYLHKLSASEMSSLSYKNGELPGITGGSSNTGSTSSGSSGTSGSNSYGYLKLGSKGDAVLRMQQKLKDLKIYSGSVSGSFGALTEDAVKAFQRKVGLHADGIAGPTTQAKLFGTDASSSSDDDGSSGDTAINDASDMGWTAFDKVNLRTEASTSSGSKALLPKYTVFTIISHSQKSSGIWYYVSVSSTKGYVRSDMLHVMTAAEVADYQKGTIPTAAPIATPAPDSSGTTTTPTTYRTLSEGSSGEDVKALQTKLKELNYYSGTLSGSFGTLTKGAVKKFQQATGLFADGIAGINTQNKLYGTNVSGADTSGGSTTPVINGVENIPWNDFKAQVTNGTLKFPNGAPATLTDVRTGKSFKIIKQSMGYHLDVEPATAADTEVLTSLYNGTITYVRRPVWLTVGTRTFAGSIYAVPHGLDTIPGNNYNGQFCVHLLHSWTHVGAVEDPDHQKCVAEAYAAAKNKL